MRGRMVLRTRWSLPVDPSAPATACWPMAAAMANIASRAGSRLTRCVEATDRPPPVAMRRCYASPSTKGRKNRDQAHEYPILIFGHSAVQVLARNAVESYIGNVFDEAQTPLAHLVVIDGAGRQSMMPIVDQLVVGRECAGIGPQRRLVVDDPEVSRSHLEIRLDAATNQAFVIDTSTNGTLLNGLRLERAVPIPIQDGDQIQVGELQLTFHSTLFTSTTGVAPKLTHARISESAMVMVVGDITNYSTIAEVTDHRLIATSLNRLWQELGHILRAHRGTLNHYAGDALYAVWELRAVPNAEELAIEFALAANDRVDELGPELSLRGPDGAPIRMGWGVVQGMAALAAMTRSVEAVIGDSTNVAFRLAGLAGRDGRAPVMVTRLVHDAVADRFRWGEPEYVSLKGRREKEMVYPALGSASLRLGKTRTTAVSRSGAEGPSERYSPPRGSVQK
jgi:adenylate cyclase